jgi:hydrogenase nickel incorporation protein HypB
VNLISSPGSGKTMLLEKTLAMLPAGIHAAVLTGDIQTDNDARRLARYGYPVRQITTAGACHLDARMVENYLVDWLEDTRPLDLLFIENVGNLVCPSSYDLGEDMRFVLLSVTEGEDKPLKYPTIFNSADVAIITKSDLAAAVEFDEAIARRNIQAVRPGMDVFELSSKTGEGMTEFLEFLERRHPHTAASSRR